MPTENRRIATYLPKHIDDCLQAFKSDRSIKGDSQALIFILSEFFGVTQEVAHQGSSSNLELQRRVGRLEEKITQLKDELLSELYKELPGEDGQSNELLSKLQVLEGRLEVLEISRNKDLTLSTGELAKRLNMDSSTLSHWKSTGKKGKSPDELLKATREKDPDGVGWILLPEINRFKPEMDLQKKSDAFQGELLGESNSELLEF